MGERRLARPVRAHDGMDLAGVHGEVEAVQDFAILDLNPEILDFKQGHFEPRQASSNQCRIRRTPLVPDFPQMQGK
jgi:hypothetical protein